MYLPRPINDLDIPEDLPDFLRPDSTTAGPKPILDIDLPEQQEQLSGSSCEGEVRLTPASAVAASSSPGTASAVSSVRGRLLLLRNLAGTRPRRRSITVLLLVAILSELGFDDVSNGELLSLDGHLLAVAKAVGVLCGLRLGWPSQISNSKLGSSDFGVRIYTFKFQPSGKIFVFL